MRTMTIRWIKVHSPDHHHHRRHHHHPTKLKDNGSRKHCREQGSEAGYFWVTKTIRQIRGKTSMARFIFPPLHGEKEIPTGVLKVLPPPPPPPPPPLLC